MLPFPTPYILRNVAQPGRGALDNTYTTVRQCPALKRSPCIPLLGWTSGDFGPGGTVGSVEPGTTSRCKTWYRRVGSPPQRSGR